MYDPNSNNKTLTTLQTLLKYFYLFIWVFLVTASFTFITSGAGLPLFGWLATLTRINLALTIGGMCAALTLITPVIAMMSSTFYDWIILGLFTKLPILRRSFNVFLIASTIAAASGDALALTPALANLAPIPFAFAIGSIAVGILWAVSAVYGIATLLFENAQASEHYKESNNISASTTMHPPKNFITSRQRQHIENSQEMEHTTHIDFPCWPL